MNHRAVGPGVRRTMMFGLASSSRTYVVVHGAESPSTDDWREYVDDMERNVARFDGMFVYTLGVGPNAAQRKYVASMWQRQPAMPKIALVTPSAVVRGITTGLNWFLPKPIQAFSPVDWTRALESYLGLPRSAHREVEDMVERYAADLGIETLALTGSG